MKKISLSVVALASLMFFGGCGTKMPENLLNEYSRTTYHGTLPCASCSGINTWVNIENDDYFLNEEYLESDDSVFKSQGKIIENKNGVFKVKFDKDEKFLKIDNKQLCILDSELKMNANYCLDKYDEFVGKKQSVFVMKKDDIYKMVINFENDSVSADVKFVCNDRKIELANVKYFNQLNAIKQVEKSEFLKTNSVINLLEKPLLDKVFKTICTK